MELTRAYVRDVYETTKGVHANTDLMASMARTAEAGGGSDNKYLLFKAFLDEVNEKSVAEIEQRWAGELASVEVFAASHVQTALIYVRRDD